MRKSRPSRENMDSSPEPAAAVVELAGVHVVFGRLCALDIECLELRAAERVFVLGRSGSGKTTLSRLIKGRLRPSTGRVRVLGEDPMAPQSVSPRGFRRRVSMIDQEFHLVPRLTVADNVLAGCLGRVSSARSFFGWYPMAELMKAEAILREVELEGLVDRRVESLSGGQRQRAAIARALMQEAEVILADEPVSALDPELAEDALQLLVDCVRRRGVTLVVNLHQPALARRFASRIIGLSQGKIVYDGPPEGFTREAADFLYAGPDRPGRVVPIGQPGQAKLEGA